MFNPDGWDDDLEDHPGFLIMMDDFMGMGQVKSRFSIAEK